MESLLAMTLLSAVFLAVTYTVVAGHHHVQESDRELRAIRLAGELMEEIVSGQPRTPFAGIDDYHGFEQAAGNLTDFTGTPYADVEQQYSRSVAIAVTTQSVPDLATDIPGRTITITIQHQKGDTWQFTRFIAD